MAVLFETDGISAAGPPVCLPPKVLVTESLPNGRPVERCVPEHVAERSGNRPWLLEGEFERNPALRATPGQIVVLELEPSSPGDFSSVRRNTVRYRLEAGTVSFCLPADEPHLMALELVKPSGKRVLRTERGGDCARVEIPAGRYQLHVEHGGTTVGSGAMAFVHDPVKARLLGGAVAPVPDFLAFTGPDPQFFLSDAGPIPSRVGATATTVGPTEVWSLGATSPYTFTDGNGNLMKVNQTLPEGDVTGFWSGDMDGENSIPMFEIADLGNWLFQMNIVWNQGDGELGQIWAYASVDPELRALSTYSTFNARYKGFDCGTSCDTLALQKGEVALFAGCNFEGPAIVFFESVPEMSLFDAAATAGLGIGEDMVASVRVGPDTFAILYPNEGFAGQSFGIGADTACLDGTTIGSSSVSAFQLLTNATDFIVATNSCRNCDLTGIDLSNFDLSGGAFSGAVFNSATLTGTTFTDASLDKAVFTDATLTNASFAGASLVNAMLGSGDLSGLDFIGSNLTGANLADASLAGTNFQLANLSDAILQGTAPLAGTDFSGAVLRCTDLSAPPFSQRDLTGTILGSFQQELLVVDSFLPAILRVDPSSGDRTIVSGPNAGSGPAFGEPQDLTFAPDGDALVTDPLLPGMVRVDPSSGDRVIVSGSGVGSGPAIGNQIGIASVSDGLLVVTDFALPGVVRVDLSSGDRTIVSGPNTGSGQGFQEPLGLAVAPNGDLLVADRGLGVVRVDLSSGDRVVLSDAGSGPLFQGPQDIAIDLNGEELLVTDTVLGLVRMDLESGDRTIVSDASTGSGPGFIDPFGIAVASDGDLWVADLGLVALLRVDPSSGDRTLVSDASTGSGPAFQGPQSVAARFASALTTDFSCRLDARGTTLEVGTFPAAVWRYLDLTGATIENATATPLSTSTDPLDLSGAILSGVGGLSGAILDGAILGCATGPQGTDVCTRLVGTDLSRTSLQSANLESALLSGANLTSANLGSADLTGAQLLESSTTAAASLVGAYLKDATLDQADLTGVALTNANFYGSGASASGATMPGADFSGAYLVGADFSNANLEGADFRSSILLNASFTSARLGADVDGSRTDFGGAYLQGADFTAADVTAASFDSAYVDLGGMGTLYFDLFEQNLEFTGCDTVSQCTGCVVASYDSPTTAPGATDDDNICPDASNGPCDAELQCAVGQGFETLQKWECPFTPIDAALPPSSSDFPTTPAGTCTSFDQVDFGW